MTPDNPDNNNADIYDDEEEDEFPEEIAEGFKNYRDQGKPLRDAENVGRHLQARADTKRSDIQEESEENTELERVVFLKEYAEDPTRSLEQVASFLQIPQKKAEDYLKKYIYLMINTISDADNPRRVRGVLNEKLPMDLRVRINDAELISLKPLVERYGDLDVINASKLKQNSTLRLMNTKPSNAYGFNLSNDPNFQMGGGGGDPYATPHMGMPPNGQQQQRQQPEKPFAKLSNSGRANMMKWVLERSPYIHYTKIDPFIELFEVNEMKLMASPDELFKFMVDYFGPQAGKISFNQFKDMISSYLKPQEQFGANPYYGGGTAGHYYGGQGWGSGGGQGGPQNGNLGYYEAMGVLPPGVDPRSQEARRAIWEFEDDRRKKKSSEEMQENIKNYVNLKMMDIVDPRAKGGMGSMGGGGDGMLTPLLMSGALRAVPTVGPDGQPRLAYENTGNATGQGGQENTMLGMMRIMMEMYQGIMMQQNQAPKFMEAILTTMIGKFQTQTDPFELAVTAKKLADTFNPPSGGVHQSIEVAKLLLARDKMSTDRDLTLQKMNFDHENDIYERKKSDGQEQQSAAQTNDIVKSIFNIGGQALVPLLSMFLGKGGAPGGMAGLASMMGQGGGGGGGGMPGMPPGMEAMMGGAGGVGPQPSGNPFEGMMGAMGGGGGGMPPGMGGGMGVNPTMGNPVDMSDIIQRQTTASQGNPQWFAEPSDMFGYGANPSPQPPQYRPPTSQEQWANFSTEPPPQYQPQAAPQQQQPQYQPQPEPQVENRNYSEKDFEQYSLEDLQALESQGVNSRSSIDSFNNALRIAKQKKMFSSAPQQQVIGTGGEVMADQTMFSAMPSNVSLEPEVTAYEKTVAAGTAKSIMDDMSEAEELLSTNTKDLRVLPDIPTAEETEKSKNTRHIEADSGDIG